MGEEGGLFVVDDPPKKDFTDEVDSLCFGELDDEDDAPLLIAITRPAVFDQCSANSLITHNVNKSTKLMCDAIDINSAHTGYNE